MKQKLSDSQTISVSHAIGFGISLQGEKKNIHLYRHYDDHQDTLTIELVKKPERLIVLATPHMAMLDTLGELKKIVAISSTQYLWNPQIIAAVEKGNIIELGSDQSLDVEAIVALNPDLVIISAFPGGLSPSLQQLAQLGIQILPMAEWQESSLLGRAEWIKVIGALVDRLEGASEIFDHIVDEYQKINRLTDAVSSKPTILSSLPYKGLWSVPGGDSYMGKLFKEAGADYFWQNSPGKGSIHLDFEAVYPIGMEADFWLSPGAVTRMEDLLAQDSRFADFPSVQSGKVYHSYKRSTINSGNDYWESGVINAHLILADVVKILHPTLLPDHKLFYFAPLN